MSADKNCRYRFHVLTEAEISNPQMVIDELFDFADLDDVRQMLWEWLKTTVSGSYNKGISRLDRETMLILYEKLQKLVEAAQSIKNTNDRMLKEKD